VSTPPICLGCGTPLRRNPNYPPGSYGYLGTGKVCSCECAYQWAMSREVNPMDQLHDVARIAADVSAASGQSYGTVYAVVLTATKILAVERRKAWQQGSVHGASHGANLQHANPYLRAAD
jgi:hypothetical protein